MKNKKKKM